MKRIATYAVFYMFFLIVNGCSGSDDCGDLACFTPPANFVFDLVDKETGINIFLSESYSPEQVTVWNKTEDRKEAFGFIIEDQLYWISIQGIGWKTEKVEYEIRLDQEVIAELYVDVERVTANCCTFSNYNEIRLDTEEYKYLEGTDVFRIFLN